MSELQESLGTLYDPFARHLDNPYPFYRQAQQATPIFFSPELNAWVVTRLTDVRNVLQDRQTYSSANVLRPLRPFSPRVFPELMKGYPPAPVFITMDGESHEQQRAPWTEGLSPDRLDSVRQHITGQASALLERMTSTGPPTDAMASYVKPLTLSVICDLMGFSPDDQHALGDDTRRAATLAMGFRHRSDEEQIEAARAWVRSQRTIHGYVVDRRANPRDDLISKVVAAYAPGDGQLTAGQESEIVGSIFGVTLAGHIDPAALLGNGLLQLLSHPEQWRLLCQQPNLIPNAVEEIARFGTPAHVYLRETTKETTLAGQSLPKGAEVAVWLAAANRDETAFERAGEFDITRTTAPDAHVAFGYGAHYCTGAGLARLEVESTLRLLTGHLPGLHLIPDQHVEFHPSLAQRGPVSVQVAW